MPDDLLDEIASRLPPQGAALQVFRACPEPWTRGAFLEFCRVHRASLIVQPDGVTVPISGGVFVSFVFPA